MTNPFKQCVLALLVRRGRAGLAYRENIKNEAIKLVSWIRRIILEAGVRLERQGKLREANDIFFLELDEVKGLLDGAANFSVAARVATRKAEYLQHQDMEAQVVVVGSTLLGRRASPGDPLPTGSTRRKLPGLPVSPGKASGQARVILSQDMHTRLLPGEVLVAPFTDPGWTPYFLNAVAIVVDIGGQLSHGSIIAREYGIPAVVNVGVGTKAIKNGQLIEVDGDLGVVTFLS